MCLYTFEFVLLILSDSPWKVHLSNVGPEMTGVAVRGLTPARTYQFRVCAVNQVGKGQYSTETSRCVNMPPSAWWPCGDEGRLGPRSKTEASRWVGEIDQSSQPPSLSDIGKNANDYKKEGKHSVCWTGWFSVIV